jgi:hypothetical protein
MNSHSLGGLLLKLVLGGLQHFQFCRVGLSLGILISLIYWKEVCQKLRAVKKS